MTFLLPPLIATGLFILFWEALLFSAADVCNSFLTGDISNDSFMAAYAAWMFLQNL